MVKLGSFLAITLFALTLPVLGAAPEAPTTIPPAEQAYDPAVKTAIQSVITQQLDALAREDGKAAQSFASPALRSKFPEPDKFLDMVKKGYGALLKPRKTTFGKLAVSPHGPLQELTIVAADGTLWSAIYSFEQVDGAWRITGCGLQKIDGQDI